MGSEMCIRDREKHLSDCFTRCVLGFMQQQKHTTWSIAGASVAPATAGKYPRELQECVVVQKKMSESVLGAFCGACSSRNMVWERYFCSGRNNVRERYRSILAQATSGSPTGTFCAAAEVVSVADFKVFSFLGPNCRSCSSRSSVWESYRSILWPREDVNNSCFCLLYTSPSPRDGLLSRMPSSA